MKKIPLALLVFTTLCPLLSGCNKPFDPSGPVETKMVVYSVISTDSDIQYVRVYANYDVSGFDPFESRTDSPISGARVVISAPTGSYTFKDTLLARPDTSRYKSPISAYVGRFRPLPGETYTLTVNATGIGVTSATVTMPKSSETIRWSAVDVLDDPDNAKTAFSIGGYCTFLIDTKAYTFQIEIEYLVPTATGWRAQNVEVPTWASDSEFTYTSYPSLYSSYGYGAGYCNKGTYITTLQRIMGLNAKTSLVFKRIILRFLQVDQNWYDYYNTVRKFQDPHSIRLDQPDFTDLSNGYGLFGACTVDSVVHEYPADFKYNH